MWGARFGEKLCHKDESNYVIRMRVIMYRVGNVILFYGMHERKTKFMKAYIAGNENFPSASVKVDKTFGARLNT